MKQKFTLSLTYAFIVLMVYMKPAHAYLDPGTGSILLQGLIAAVAGVMATGGLYWSRIKNFFLGNKKDMAKKTNEENVDE